MKLGAEAGLWSTAPLAAPPPMVAVLEVSGAVLSWTVDGPTDADITFTDLAQADWLWRILGESGHSAVVSALSGRSPGGTVDVEGVELLPGSADVLRRLALGHWLRRWWPASRRDGIAPLDGALLDAEIAVLTAGTQDFFSDHTFDSDVAQLLRPHAATLNAHVQHGDPRVVALVTQCRELADDTGVALDAEPAVAMSRQDDYALAAGTDSARHYLAAVAAGVASINWAAVPPGVFDAAEDTVHWSIEVADGVANTVVRTELSGEGTPSGIAVRLQSGAFSGSGILDADGRARLSLVDAQQHPMTESAAWNHDWQATTITVGADVDESVQTRDRVRAFARSRLSEPADDAFLAEILAAESDY